MESQRNLLNLQLGNKLLLFYLLDTVKSQEGEGENGKELGLNGDTLPQIWGCGKTGIILSGGFNCQTTCRKHHPISQYNQHPKRHNLLQVFWTDGTLCAANPQQEFYHWLKIALISARENQPSLNEATKWVYHTLRTFFLVTINFS